MLGGARFRGSLMWWGVSSLGWPRGRVLGGSSAINGLLHVRGQPEDYDGWAAAGCDG